MGDFANGRGDAFVHDEQIVVGIEGQMVGIEWSLGLGDGLSKPLGKKPGNGEECRTETEGAEKATTVLRKIELVHGIPFGYSRLLTIKTTNAAKKLPDSRY